MPAYGGAWTGGRGGRPDRGLAGLPGGQPGQRTRPPRDRRLRRGRAGRRARHAPPTSTPRTTCAPAPAPTARPSSGAAPTSRSSSPASRLPCTAAYRLFAEEGLSVDVASGGELHMALRAGFDPARIHMHGNNKSDEEILFAARAGVGHLILDSFDEIERCERLLDEPQDVLVRVTPGIKPSTHDYVQTGQLDSKFGFGLEDGLAARAIERVLASDVLKLSRAARPHRLADLRAGALHAGDPGDRRAGRRVVQGRQRRRRAGHRLHGRGRAALDRRLRRGQGARRRRGLRRGGEDPDRARPLAGRQRRASPPTGSARSRRSPASAPTSRSTAACRTTCGRCSTAPATRP